MSSSATTIDDLPAEMLFELFKHLSARDLVVCSMVNKRLHSAYSGFKLDRLVVGDNKWLYPGRRIEELCPVQVVGRLADKPLLSNLKHLVWCGKSSYLSRSKFSRLLHQLVHLEISNRFDRKGLNLNMPKLKVLTFHWSNDRCPLSIDCAELSTLVYNEHPDVDLLDVRHPETIRKLNTNLCGPKLARFKEIDCLITHHFKAICKATLLSLPRLKELRFDENVLDVLRYEFDEEDAIGGGFDNQAEPLDRLQQTLKEFTNDVAALRGADFRFRFSGFSVTKLAQIDFGVPEQLSTELFFMANYHLMDPSATLSFIRLLDYNRLTRIVARNIPACFFHRFTGIEKIYAKGKIQDANHFLGFLKRLGSLKRLHLDYPQLAQESIDQLPAYSASLFEFELSDSFKLQLNFEFIGKFSHLSSLTIQGFLSIESFASLVRYLGRLREGRFFLLDSHRKQFHIWKREGSNFWKVSRLPNRMVLKTEHPDEIVNFLQALDPPQNSAASD